MNLLSRSHTRLTNLLPPSERASLQDRFASRNVLLETNLRRQKLKKLNNLIDKKCNRTQSSAHSTPPPSPPFAQPIVNLTDVVIPADEMNRSGKKFAIYPSDKSNTLQSIVTSNLAAGLRGNNRLNTSKVRELIQSMTVHLHTRVSPDTKSFLSLRRRLRDQELVLVKADKREPLSLPQKWITISR